MRMKNAIVMLAVVAAVAVVAGVRRLGLAFLFGTSRAGCLLHGFGSCGLLEDLVDQLGFLCARHGFHAQCLGDCHELLTVLRFED